MSLENSSRAHFEPSEFLYHKLFRALKVSHKFLKYKFHEGDLLKLYATVKTMLIC